MLRQRAFPESSRPSVWFLLYKLACMKLLITTQAKERKTHTHICTVDEAPECSSPQNKMRSKVFGRTNIPTLYPPVHCLRIQNYQVALSELFSSKLGPEMIQMLCKSFSCQNEGGKHIFIPLIKTWQFAMLNPYSMAMYLRNICFQNSIYCINAILLQVFQLGEFPGSCWSWVETNGREWGSQPTAKFRDDFSATHQMSLLTDSNIGTVLSFHEVSYWQTDASESH